MKVMDVLKDDFSLLDLFNAYFDCRKHKRNTASAINFEYDLENNLMQLYRELKSGTYKIGRCICFVVTKPKPREVWAANFRDRIVHHLIYNAIKDRFYARFIKDTYSCIPKRGTLHAAKRLLHFSRSVTNNYTKKAYYMKCDLSNFFVSINKNILFELLKKHVSETWILNLLEQVVYNDPRQNVYKKSSRSKFALLPEHKSLWNRDDTCGLPIGNLTSQFFSNVYLDVLDQYVKKTLRCKYYIRYVDDFIILHEDVKQMKVFFNKIQSFLEHSLNLVLHCDKKLVNKVPQGIDFIGFIIKPHRIFLRQRTLKRIFASIRLWKKSDSCFCKEGLTAFFKTINSYLGMLVNINQYFVRQQVCLCSNTLFISGNTDCNKLCTRNIA